MPTPLTPEEYEAFVRGTGPCPCVDCDAPRPRPGDPWLYFALGMLAMLAIDIAFTALFKVLS